MRLVAAILAAMRAHSWEVDADWIKENGVRATIEAFEAGGALLTRMRCAKCGKVSEPYPVTNFASFKQEYRKRGCPGKGPGTGSG